MQAKGRVTVLGNDHPPSRVLCFLDRDSVAFVQGLIDLVVLIAGEDRSGVRLVVLSNFGGAEESARVLGRPLPAQVEVLAAPRAAGHYLQDLGEFLAWRAPGQAHASLALFDSIGERNRHGLTGLGRWLARRWGLPLLPNPDPEDNGGNDGGNIEASPDEVLVLGSTASGALVEFFLERGYVPDPRHERPVVLLDTSWLLVGHVDELVTFVPTPREPCGYVVLKASPAAGLEAMQRFDHEDRAAESRTWFPTSGEEDSFRRTNLALAGRIDAELMILREATAAHPSRCRELRVVPVPVVYHCREVGGLPRDCSSRYPGGINCLVLGRHLVVGDPRRNSLRAAYHRLAADLGLQLHFVDSPLHSRGGGDVHCLTNVVRELGAAKNALPGFR
ncbi:MAG: hypothetical protein A2284_09060 [Deltaproteobacteria bacterium RIFOXYA12_FULL_61_11]|nr:MAG: hypothetical protein A2284_09060 [Deltaproteobacteria bacterium RIFOXYA12_FULL_61_11]